MIDRRNALAGIVAMFGAQLFAPIARAAASGSLPDAIDEGPPSIPVFNTIQRAAMIALADRVIPETDTPGAIAAGVPTFIEKLLADWALPPDRAPILAGLDSIEACCRRDHAVAVAQATAAQQDALLTLAMADAVPGGGAFFILFRQLVITGYYTSEIGMTQEREYLPVPAGYDGAFPYAKVGKVYSA